MLLAAAAVPLLALPAYAAGDVQVTVDARGRMELVGDDLGNEIQIDKDVDVGGFVVLGRNGTTVNGAAQFVTANVKSIRATMGAGDDVLAMGGFRLKKRLHVDLGEGDDRVSLFHNTLRGRVTFQGGPGNDSVIAEAGTKFMRGVRIGTGEGDDTVRIADSEVHGRMRMFTGSGADRVELHRDGFTDLGSLAVRTGAGDDWFEVIGCTFQAHVHLLTSDGEDTVYFTTSRFRRPVTIKTGPLDDEIELERATFDAALNVNGGGGVNSVVFIGLTISGGSGGSKKYSWRFVIVHFFP